MFFDILYFFGGQTACDIYDPMVNGTFESMCQMAALVNMPIIDNAVNMFGWFIH